MHCSRTTTSTGAAEPHTPRPQSCTLAPHLVAGVRHGVELPVLGDQLREQQPTNAAAVAHTVASVQRPFWCMLARKLRRQSRRCLPPGRLTWLETKICSGPASAKNPICVARARQARCITSRMRAGTCPTLRLRPAERHRPQGDQPKRHRTPAAPLQTADVGAVAAIHCCRARAAHRPC